MVSFAAFHAIWPGMPLTQREGGGAPPPGYEWLYDFEGNALYDAEGVRLYGAI